jgi:hypothetical protein
MGGEGAEAKGDSLSRKISYKDLEYLISNFYGADGFGILCLIVENSKTE